MADVRAFRGFRYDLGRVGSLADVVAPPYDVVDAALQNRLYDASPYNAIRVELTRGEPGIDRYTLAARTLKDWISLARWAMSAASSSIETPFLIRRTFVWESTSLLSGIRRGSPWS